MSKKICSLLFLVLIAQKMFAQNNRVIVKFKPQTDYSFNYTTGQITTSDALLAYVLNNSHILKISSPLPAGIAAKKPGLKMLQLISHIYFFDTDTAFDKLAIIKKLTASGLFEYAESDYTAKAAGVRRVNTTANDTYILRQWGLKNDGSFMGNAIAGADVKMQGAWDVSTGSSSTVVCILDTGIKLGHPEFAGRLWVNTGEIPGNNIDDDNNGYIDDVNGWDWANNDNNATDDYGHGTNVAGIALATGNNSLGYAGANWKCKIMAGKVLSANNFGYYSWWISGITYAVLNGAKIINMSIGGSDFSQASQDACDFAHANDVAIFACMMNENNDVVYYPAGFASTIAVGATDVNDHRVAPFFWSATSGSNYGAHIDFVAPGNYIYGLDYLSDANYNSYWGGTSQATPLAAGIGSLICAIKPNATVEEIRNILRSTAQDQVGAPSEDTPGWDMYMGAGRLDANAAVHNVYPCAGNAVKFSVDPRGDIYQWQVNTGNGFADVAENSFYSGESTSALIITGAPSAWYGYQYRCIINGAYSNVFTLVFTAYWVGGISTAWENPSNWACGLVPDGNTDVIINNGNPFYPQISSAAVCRSANISKAVSVKVNTGFSFTVKK